MTDDPARSPNLLMPHPKRGKGVRRLNHVPLLIAGGFICLVIGAIGYTYRDRLASSTAAADEAKRRPESASGASILDGAPRSGEIQHAVFRTPEPPPPVTQQAQAQTQQTGQQTQEEDPATKARRQAWDAYYQQLAGLQAARLQAATDALKAGTTVQGFGPATETPAQQAPAAPGGIEMPQLAGLQAALGGLGGMGGMASDPTGAREKQAFIRQTGNLGQDDTLPATVRDPISPYLVTAGDVIPSVAVAGANSDTPGQFVGRVSRSVCDSATGHFLLIPQNSKVIGTYDSVVSTGQTRIPTVLTRIIFPDSSSIPIGAMPAADQSGFAGLHDQVNRHWLEKFGNAAIVGLLGAAGQLSQGSSAAGPYGTLNAGQVAASGLGNQLSQFGQEFARAGMSIPNTIMIRPGYSFNIQVTKDIILRPYVDRRGVQPSGCSAAGSQVQTVSLGPVMR